MRKIAVLFLLALAAWAGEFKVEKVFPVQGKVSLRGSITAGRIRVKVWDKPQIRVFMEVKYKGRKPEVEIYREDDEVYFRLRGTGKSKFCLFSCEEISYFARVEVDVPKKYSLHLRTVSADIQVQGGEMEEGEIHTVSGEIALEGISAEDLMLKSVSGPIKARGDGVEEVYASSVSGDIVLSFSRLGKAKVNSVSGDVYLEGSSSRRWCVSSVSGDLHLRPLSRVCYMKLSSTGGDVVVDSMRISGKVERRDCEDGLYIKARTVSGDVLLKIKH